jgi:predicted transcriptional regulator
MMIFCHHCQQRHGENYECDAVKVLRCEKLKDELAALREENEELKEQVERWKTAAKATMDTLEANQRRTALRSRLEIPRPEGV